jgi:hypothetical protein
VWKSDTGRVFDDTASSLLRAQMQEKRTADNEPMSAAHAESPFEEPAADLGYSSEAFAVEHPEGMHVARVPIVAEGAHEPPMTDIADVFAPAESAIPGAAEDLANTLTMADLYARQGLHDDARRIYDSILERDPRNAAVRSKRDALTGAAPQPATSRDPKVEKLERWLRKVARKEAGGV